MPPPRLGDSPKAGPWRCGTSRTGRLVDYPLVIRTAMRTVREGSVGLGGRCRTRGRKGFSLTDGHVHVDASTDVLRAALVRGCGRAVAKAAVWGRARGSPVLSGVAQHDVAAAGGKRCQSCVWRGWQRTTQVACYIASCHGVELAGGKPYALSPHRGRIWHGADWADLFAEHLRRWDQLVQRVCA